MKLDKLINIKAGFFDGAIIAWDTPGLLLGYICDRAGKDHCFVGRQVAKGEIVDFLSKTRKADISSASYKLSRGLGFVMGLPSAPVMTPATSVGNLLRHLDGYHKKHSYSEL